MKKLFLLVVLCQFFALFAYGQYQKVLIKTFNEGKQKGYIVDMDSVNLIMTRGWSETAVNESYKVIPIRDIHYIRFKGKSKTGLGVGIGAGSGLVTGVTLEAAAASAEASLFILNLWSS